MKSPCIVVPKKKGEEVRKALIDKGLLNIELAINRDEEFLYLPLVGGERGKEVLGYEVIERDFQVLERGTKSYKELLDLSDELKSKLPTSFDVVGNVAIIKLQDEVLEYKEIIGKALLSANKSIETVALDRGVVGEERVRNLEVVAGQASTETVHKEYGIELETDPANVYFSPRLATEHWRIAQMVEDGDVVIDMFCGIGPFSILIAKNRKPKMIYAIDINEKAIGYLRKNIERNKVSNIEPTHGDSKVIVPKLEHADRIIMNLPHSAFEYLSSAFSNIKDKGTIHYYEILGHEKKEERWVEIDKEASNRGIKLEKLGEREVHTYSPESSLYCFDFKVSKGKGHV
ncbi:MAG: class I SAM-dependent methyltransferase family protein [Thermoplasmata archaeon]|nr:MAG: class I SAM-dependent methyltransferase family protein [Thermoplasmata archaeon]